MFLCCRAWAWLPPLLVLAQSTVDASANRSPKTFLSVPAFQWRVSILGLFVSWWTTSNGLSHSPGLIIIIIKLTFYKFRSIGKWSSFLSLCTWKPFLNPATVLIYKRSVHLLYDADAPGQFDISSRPWKREKEEVGGTLITPAGRTFWWTFLYTRVSDATLDRSLISLRVVLLLLTILLWASVVLECPTLDDDDDWKCFRMICNAWSGHLLFMPFSSSFVLLIAGATLPLR